MLLSNFNLLATAPGGVARLRELILTLAVQGKLVPQDPSDEPATMLLKKIRAEKDRLIAEGKIRRDKPLAEITDEEKPFELPVGWEWVRLGALLPFRIGKTPPSKDPQYWGSEGHAWVSISDMEHFGEIRETQRKITEKGAAVFGYDPLPIGTLIMSFKLTIGKISILQLPAFHNEAIISFQPLAGLDIEFLKYSLPTVSKTGASKNALMGQTLNTESLSNLIIAVPPTAEQSRIVTRIEELMRACDALEAKGKLEAAQHIQLVSTLLGTLADSDTPETLAQNWQHIASHFDLLLDRPQAIDAFEQTILHLAVRGLLVPQDPSDEPASVLLRRVAQNVSARFAKTSNTSKDGDEIPAPYDLPNSWTWVRLGQLVENMGSGWSPACNEGERSDPTQWAVLRTTAVQVNEYRPCEHKVVPLKLSPRPEIEVKDGDILITRAGPMNRVGISCWVSNTPPRLMLSDKIVRFHSVADEMLPAFVVLALNAGWTKNQIEAAKTGMAASQVNITQADLRGLWMPVCSKAEQFRIVTCVEELRRLCADLRQRLSSSQTIQAYLAEALVNDVQT